MPPHENEERSYFSPGMTRWLSAACFCAVGMVIFLSESENIYKNICIYAKISVLLRPNFGY